ncbi:MAG: hypothetical protein WC180_03930 [Candidatus Paceibacterota bacterium]|jgi:hypothetical protein
MPEQRVTIEINEDGNITAKTSGFYGDICMDALTDILGEEEVPMTIKPSDDYYQHIKTSSREILQQKGGKK